MFDARAVCLVRGVMLLLGSSAEAHRRQSPPFLSIEESIPSTDIKPIDRHQMSTSSHALLVAVHAEEALRRLK